MNLEIQRIEDYLHENKGTYFSLYYGDSFAIKEKLFEPLDKKNTGKKRFTEVLDKLLKYEPDYIIVRIFRLAKVKFKGKPELEEKIFLKKQANQSFAGFGSMEHMVETKTNISILSAENKRLEAELNEAKTELSNFRKENKNYELKTKELNEKIREQLWDKKELERDFKVAIQNIEQQNDKFDKILEIGGRIAMEKAEQAGVDISGFLSGLGSPAPQEKLPPQKTDAEVEFSPSESKEKEQARIIATQILDNLNIIIDKNSDVDVLGIINKIVNIYNYSTRSTENLNEIHDLIYSQQSNTTE